MSDALSDDDVRTLRYMLREGRPLFGGCFEFERMREMYPDGFPDMEQWARQGLVERAYENGRPIGYELTDRGREVARNSAPGAKGVCPTCGRPL